MSPISFHPDAARTACGCESATARPSPLDARGFVVRLLQTIPTLPPGNDRGQTPVTWVTGLASPGVVITNSGTIASTARAIDTSGSAISGNFTLLNNAGAVLTSAIDVFRINGGLSSGSVTVNNAGTIQSTATGRVFDFVNATSNSTVFSITNQAGAIIQSQSSDVMRDVTSSYGGKGVVRYTW
jgi:hypothetical protein